jgi:8-oxo-dGTP diphosphatase
VSGHKVWDGDGWREVAVADLGGEPLVVANVAALVFPDDARNSLVLQRRDRPGEPVRGLLELPSGRWRAGETPEEAVAREVEEETGLIVRSVEASARRYEAHTRRPFMAVEPLVVTVGVGGAYPALHLTFACIAEGEPRARPGETADPRWYSIEAVRSELENPRGFTGPAFAVLNEWLVASRGP